MRESEVNVELLVYSTKSHYFTTHSGAFTVKECAELGVMSIKNILDVFICRGVMKKVGGAAMKLLGVGGAAEHLADGLRDGIAVDAVDLEQLMWFATAGDVGHSQAVQIEAGLIDHC